MISCKFSISFTDDGIKSEKLLLNIIFKPLVFDLPVVKNDVVKKTEYNKLVTKVDNINTTGFVLKTKYGSDKSDLEKN